MRYFAQQKHYLSNNIDILPFNIDPYTARHKYSVENHIKSYLCSHSLSN